MIPVKTYSYRRIGCQNYKRLTNWLVIRMFKHICTLYMNTWEDIKRDVERVSSLQEWFVQSADATFIAVSTLKMFDLLQQLSFKTFDVI